MRTILMTALLVGLLVLQGTSQVTHLVPGSFSTIQGAINGAMSGDTLLVAPGTYFERIDFHLTAASPCIDKGDKTLPGIATHDIDNFWSLR